ncbi:hypothetical protein AgCh_039670 [Apium graveolens]
MTLGGASTSSGGRGNSSGGRGRGRGRGGDTGISDGGDRGRRRVMGRGDGDDAMDIENGGRVDDEEEDIAIIVERLQRRTSQGDFHRRPINGVKLGTVHIVDGCKEKSRADKRVKLAISLGYTHVTRLMVKPHYFNEGAWESITKHWEMERFKKASDIGR